MSSATQSPEAPQFSRWVAPDVRGISTPHELLSEASIARLRAEAKEAGHAEGFKAGLAEGQALTRARLELFGKLSEQLLEPLGKLEPEALECMVELSVAIGRSLINRELSLDSSLVLGAVSSALNAMPTSSAKLRVLVNPLDMELVTAAYSEIGRETNLAIAADPSVERGGAVVESGSTLIDAQFDTRLQSLLDTLLNPVAADDF